MAVLVSCTGSFADNAASRIGVERRAPGVPLQVHKAFPNLRTAFAAGNFGLWSHCEAFVIGFALHQDALLLVGLEHEMRGG